MNSEYGKTCKTKENYIPSLLKKRIMFNKVAIFLFNVVPKIPFTFSFILISTTISGFSEHPLHVEKGSRAIQRELALSMGQIWVGSWPDPLVIQLNESWSDSWSKLMDHDPTYDPTNLNWWIMIQINPLNYSLTFTILNSLFSTF